MKPLAPKASDQQSKQDVEVLGISASLTSATGQLLGSNGSTQASNGRGSGSGQGRGQYGGGGAGSGISVAGGAAASAYLPPQASSSPAGAHTGGPRSHPIVLPAQELSSGISGGGYGGPGMGIMLGGGSGGGAGPMVASRPYHATEYMSPVKVDPAKLSAIGPLSTGLGALALGAEVLATNAAARGYVSDPGAEAEAVAAGAAGKGLSAGFSFPPAPNASTTSSLSAAGAPLAYGAGHMPLQQQLQPSSSITGVGNSVSSSGTWGAVGVVGPGQGSAAAGQTSTGMPAEHNAQVRSPKQPKGEQDLCLSMLPHGAGALNG